MVVRLQKIVLKKYNNRFMYNSLILQNNENRSLESNYRRPSVKLVKNATVL